MDKSILIRCDGSNFIGLGHVVRCISLAHILSADFNIEFYCKEITESLISAIRAQNWDIHLIDEENEFFSAIKSNDVIILDGYKYNSEYQLSIKKLGNRLIVIDDLATDYMYADIVINHAPGINELSYQGEEYCRYLLGPNYALLRPEFLAKPKKKELKGTIKDLIICFGGSDVNNVTTKILTWLPRKNYSISVITGNAYIHKADLNRIIEQRDDLQIKLHDSLTAQEMKEELEKADLAIVPASGILFEAISRNLPVISGYYFENQKLFYNGFRNEGVFIDAMNFTQDKFDEALHEAEYSDLEELLRNQCRIIDFSSSERILRHIKALSL